MTPTGGRPLARFSVLDLTTVRSGPTCTKILADFGAGVLRVERPGRQGLMAEGVIEQHKGETK